jgi:uncharacterized protein (TIRG00374 family)
MSHKRRLAFTTLGAIIFIAYLAYTKPFSVLFQVGVFDLLIFILAIAINYLGLFFLAYSWHILLKIMDVKISLLKSIRVTFFSMLVVWMFPIPSGVEIIRAFLVKDEEGSNIGKAVSSVVISKVYYFISFGVLITLAAAVVTFIRGAAIPVNPVYIWFVVIYALTNTVIFMIILTPNILKKIYEKSPKTLKEKIFDKLYNPAINSLGFIGFVDELEISLGLIREKPLLNLISLLMVTFHWSTGSITAYLVASSLDFPISFWNIVLIYAVIEFIQQLNIIIPSGLGIVDTTLTAAIHLSGVPLATASAISLLTRLATYWLELVLCAFTTLQENYSEAIKSLR